MLGWDEATGRYWQLFVNGEASSVGASSVNLRADDTVMWYYAADGASLPSEGDTTNPDAERPELDADWPGFAGGSAGATVTTPTPTEAADAWKYDFKDGASWATVSDPFSWSAATSTSLHRAKSSASTAIPANLSRPRRPARTRSTSAVLFMPTD